MQTFLQGLFISKTVPVFENPPRQEYVYCKTESTSMKTLLKILLMVSSGSLLICKVRVVLFKSPIVFLAPCHVCR